MTEPLCPDDDMTEEPRPEPDFRVYVLRGSEPDDPYRWADQIDVTHAVMDIYDIVINSMDFGSGFLSTEEVNNLRILGEAIGAKPFRYQGREYIITPSKDIEQGK